MRGFHQLGEMPRPRQLAALIAFSRHRGEALVLRPYFLKALVLPLQHQHPSVFERIGSVVGSLDDAQ